MKSMVPVAIINAAAILAGLFVSFFDRALHVEGLLGNIVVFAIDDFLKAFDCIGYFHVLSLQGP